jgi:hypothetical protein
VAWRAALGDGGGRGSGFQPHLGAHVRRSSRTATATTYCNGTWPSHGATRSIGLERAEQEGEINSLCCISSESSDMDFGSLHRLIGSGATAVLLRCRRGRPPSSAPSASTCDQLLSVVQFYPSLNRSRCCAGEFHFIRTSSSGFL